MRFSLTVWVIGLSLACVNLTAAAHGNRAAAAHSHCSTPAVTCAKTVTPTMDQQGNLWIAFVNNDIIYLQQRLASGQFGPALQVNQQPEVVNNQGEDRPKLAFGPKGEIYLSWTTPLAADYSGNIRFTRSLDAGKTFSKPATVNQDGFITSHRFSALATNTKGDVFLAWIDKRDHFSPENLGKKNSGGAIYFTYSTDQGAHFQAQDIALKKHSCECCRIAISIDAQQQPLVFFRDIFANSERDHALVRFTNYQPQPAERINFDHWQINGCPHQGPDIYHGKGITHFTWFSHKQLYYRQQDTQGTLSKPIPVGGNGSQHGSFAYANSTLYLVYQQYANDAMNIWLQSSLDNGQSWSQPKVIASTGGASDYPFLLSNGKHLELVWLSQEQGLLIDKISADSLIISYENFL